MSSATRTARASRRIAVLAAGTAATSGAVYWLMMSPYSQTLGPFPYRGPAGRRVVALTFDDGPNEPYTSQLADYLDRASIPATFFQVGRAAERYPEVTTRLVAAGHVIGLHGHTHEFTRYLRRDTLAEELEQGMAVFAQLGIRPALYRPPWLLRIPALQDLLHDHALQVVSGEFCHPLEVAQPSPERIARHALRAARPGSILIFHDGRDGKGGDRAATVKAVTLVVDQLRDRSYSFVTVDRLLGVPAYQALAGQPARE
jgi:peptidoglycan-N-acetylglucosamine deacetylase